MDNIQTNMDLLEPDKLFVGSGSKEFEALPPGRRQKYLTTPAGSGDHQADSSIKLFSQEHRYHQDMNNPSETIGEKNITQTHTSDDSSIADKSCDYGHSDTSSGMNELDFNDASVEKPQSR